MNVAVVQPFRSSLAAVSRAIVIISSVLDISGPREILDLGDMLQYVPPTFYKLPVKIRVPSRCLQLEKAMPGGIHF
jgi:hypothetical protein